jgi:hypothetical protein
MYLKRKQCVSNNFQCHIFECGSIILHVWVTYGVSEMAVRKSKYLATRHGRCTVWHSAVYCAAGWKKWLPHFCRNCRNYVYKSGPPELLVLVLEYCASLMTHCQGSVSHKLHCSLLCDINAEPLTVPVRCTSVSYWVVQNSSRVCGTASFFTVFWNSVELDSHI